MGKDIKGIATYYVGLYKTNDPFELADYLSIEVQKGNLGDYSGCYMYLKKHRCILLSNDLDDDLLKTVMAHELGHAILHKKTNCCFMASKTLLLTSKIERQANKFAAELLISDDLISEYKDFTISQISTTMRVDEALIRLKLDMECNS